MASLTHHVDALDTHIKAIITALSTDLSAQVFNDNEADLVRLEHVFNQRGVINAAVAVMAVLATSWGADGADAVFGQDCAGIERDVLFSELSLLLLSEDGAYGMVVRHAMLCATTVVALAVPIRAVAVVAVFAASGL